MRRSLAWRAMALATYNDLRTMKGEANGDDGME